MAEIGKSFTSNRILMFARVKEICQEICPENIEKVISILQYKTGLSKDKAKEYLKVLYDNGEVKIDQTSLIVSMGDKE